MSQATETALIDVTKKAADSLTPKLREAATAANWPSDVVVSIAVKADKDSLYIDYPETFEERINNLEYGEVNQSPNAVFRPFFAKYSTYLEEFIGTAMANMLVKNGGL